VLLRRDEPRLGHCRILHERAISKIPNPRLRFRALLNEDVISRVELSRT
jgi:hypothetical protein